MIKKKKPSFYGRQSVDKADSISIESQLEICMHEFNGENYRKYADKGFSGKNTDRPMFQEMIRDIEQGYISKVVVYKLDRISRSIIDFARMIELFGKHNVEFVSATEKFDTSTPMGRAMLNICIVFAQLERETIQMRVIDSYYSRCQKGFHMSGKPPYGYKLKPTTINGKNSNMYHVDEEAAERVKMMFEMYAKPHTTFGEIARYLCNDGTNGKEFSRVTLAALLKNPAYAQSGIEIYDFFKSQGADIINDAADFNGINGCYLFQGRGVAESKRCSLKGQILVVAPHEGIIPSETWLACRKKLMTNVLIKRGRTAVTTWIAGKIKCGRCGSGLTSIKSPLDVAYLRCRKRSDRKSCEGCGKLHVLAVEKTMHAEMCRKMEELKTLMGISPLKENPKLAAYKLELAQVEADIKALLDTLTGASAILMSYANGKIEELDKKRQPLLNAIAKIMEETPNPKRLKQVSDYLKDWDNVKVEDKRAIFGELVSKVRMTSQEFNIEWKINYP